jgi:hypothetical protein
LALKILPLTPFYSEILTETLRDLHDSARPQGEGVGAFPMSMYPTSIPRCQHVKVNGTLCGSPALHRRRYCFFHQQWRERRIQINAHARRRARSLDLPVLEDANSIQVTLMQVMRLLVAGQIEHKTAGLLLYALQTASVNLKHTEFEPTIKEHVVMDPREIPNASLGAKLWNPDDYEDEEEESEEDEDDQEANAEGGQEQTAGESEEDEDDDTEASASSSNPGKKPPQTDPHYDHPIRIAMRDHPRFKAAVAEMFSTSVNDPWLDTMDPHTLDDRSLKEICGRIGIHISRRER